MNTVLILWVLPTAAILGAILLLARQVRAATPKGALESGGVSKRELAAVAQPAVMEQPPTPDAPPLRSVRASEKDPGSDPLSGESLERICSLSGVRTISILTSIQRPRVQAEENVEILVEFEPYATPDYTVVFRLRQELLTMVGHQVKLVCRNSARPGAQQGLFERARVLYAA